MTRIVFDNHGKPHWYTVPAEGAYLHNIDTYRAQDTTPPFTEADLDWFRKPLSRTGECQNR